MNKEITFMGIPIIINDTVYTPSSKLLEVCNRIIQENANKKNLNILDIGCGTGCIALVLNNYLDTNQVVMVDINDDSEIVSNLNIQQLQVLDKVRFIKSDLFNNIPNDMKFDIIVANLPSKSSLDNSDMRHNPNRNAYEIGDNNSYGFYNLLYQSQKYLNFGGSLYVSNCNEQKITQNLLKFFFYNSIEPVSAEFTSAKKREELDGDLIRKKIESGEIKIDELTENQVSDVADSFSRDAIIGLVNIDYLPEKVRSKTVERLLRI